jgi:ABC-type multidrug transport system fused ATPase/permease subunit
MLIDQHPYLFIYLLGCVLVVILSIFKMILFWIISWITKDNILGKNLKKVLPPDEKTFLQKAIWFIAVFTLEAALSWINVIVVFWLIMTTVLKYLREALSSTPEAIKLLRFPLKNNPHMSREAVWAYLYALQMKVGERTPTESDILFSLNELSEHYPSLDRKAALNQLSSLNVMSTDVISSVLDGLSFSEGEA